MIQESIYEKSIPFIFSSDWTAQESKNRFFTDLLDENRFIDPRIDLWKIDSFHF